MGTAVEEFGAAALWCILQAYALSVPHVFNIHELWAGVALVVAVVGFQVVLYAPGAPNAAVQLGSFLSQTKPTEEKKTKKNKGGVRTRGKSKATEQEEAEKERIGLAQAARMVTSTMAGAVVGSVFARDTMSWAGFPVEGMKPPITHFPELGDNFVLGVETVTSLVICALSVLVFPKRPTVGLAGLFLVPVPAGKRARPSPPPPATSSSAGADSACPTLPFVLQPPSLNKKSARRSPRDRPGLVVRKGLRGQELRE